MSNEKYPTFSFSKSRSQPTTGSGSLLSNLQYNLDESKTLTRNLHHDIREMVKVIYVESLDK